MMLSQSLRYPFQGKGWFRRTLILTLVQFLPVVGQLILLGYGLDIVRAVYAGQPDLPPIRWLPALGNGFRFLLAGFFYLLPIPITIGILGATSIRSGSSFGSFGVIVLLLANGLPLLPLLLRTVTVRRTSSSSVRQPQARGGGLRVFLSGLLPIFVTVAVTLILSALVSNSGIEAGKPNGLSVILLVVLVLVLFLIGMVLYVGGVRYAIENKGLLAPITNAKLLLKDRALTGILFLNVILLDVITVIAITVGIVLFVLPGLFVFVICSLALWYMFAQYTIKVGINKLDSTLIKSATLIS